MTGLGCVFNKDVSEKGCEIPSKFEKKMKYRNHSNNN